MNSTVGQLNSQFGKGVNELRLTYTRGRDHRESPIGNPPFPQITVQLTPTVSIVSGTEQFSARNAIDQDIMELNDAYTVLKGRHTVTIGTHNEFLNLKNLFIRDNFGTYRFSTLANFEAGLAQQYDHSFSATSDPLQRAAFKVNQWGFYAGDSWRARSNMTVTYGIRLDAPTFPTKPNANPASVANFGFATDVVPSHVEWSPRVGINYDLNGNGTQQIRGGIGLFTGRPAYVWISNQFGNTGIDFTRIGAPTSRGTRRRAEQHPVHYRSAEPAEQGDRRPGRHVHERDRHDRSRLQVPVGAARQPRLRPPAAVGLRSAPPTSSGRTPSTTSSTRT